MGGCDRLLCTELRNLQPKSAEEAQGKTDPSLQVANLPRSNRTWAEDVLYNERISYKSPLRKQVADHEISTHSPTRHGDVVFQVNISFVAQSVDLSVWQDVQAFGILYLSVIAGEMNLKVWELTNEPGTPWAAIFGM
jgi:hypothetical protein